MRVVCNRKCRGNHLWIVPGPSYQRRRCLSDLAPNRWVVAGHRQYDRSGVFTFQRDRADPNTSFIASRAFGQATEDVHKTWIDARNSGLIQGSLDQKGTQHASNGDSTAVQTALATETPWRYPVARSWCRNIDLCIRKRAAADGSRVVDQQEVTTFSDVVTTSTDQSTASDAGTTTTPPGPPPPSSDPNSVGSGGWHGYGGRFVQHSRCPGEYARRGNGYRLAVGTAGRCHLQSGHANLHARSDRSRL